MGASFFSRFLIVTFVILPCSFIGATEAVAQTEGASFLQLLQADATNASSGASQAERSQAFVAWMASNSWESLPVGSQLDLLKGLAADNIDMRRFSVRWTGFLTASETGLHAIQLVEPLFDVTVIKLWLNGQLILDSSGREAPSTASAPIQLAANEAVSIRIELKHELKHPVTESAIVPMAVLAWKRGDAPLSLIPTTAFTTSEDQPTQQGLTAEYFPGTEITGAPTVTRTDPAIEFVWHAAPVVPIYSEQYQAVKENIWGNFASGEAFATLEGSERAAFMRDVVPRVAETLTVSQRERLVESILDDSAAQQATTATTMSELMEAVYMLPEGEHVDLLVAWTLVKSHPTVEIGQYPREGEGFFETVNTSPYRRIGFLLQGGNREHVQRIWSEGLRRTDGQCNIRLVTSTATTAHVEALGRQLFDAIHDGSENEDLSGDQHATWLIAKARALSIMVDGVVRPMRGMQLLEEAMLTAESGELRFLILQEMVAILASLDMADDATRLMDQYQGEFSSPDQQAAIAAWQQAAATLENVYVEVRQRPNLQPRLDHIAELERRYADAQANSKQAEVERYQTLLEAVRAKLGQESIEQ